MFVEPVLLFLLLMRNKRTAATDNVMVVTSWNTIPALLGRSFSDVNFGFIVPVRTLESACV